MITMWILRRSLSLVLTLQSKCIDLRCNECSNSSVILLLLSAIAIAFILAIEFFEIFSSFKTDIIVDSFENITFMCIARHNDIHYAWARQVFFNRIKIWFQVDRIACTFVLWSVRFWTKRLQMIARDWWLKKQYYRRRRHLLRVSWHITANNRTKHSMTSNHVL